MPSSPRLFAVASAACLLIAAVALATPTTATTNTNPPRSATLCVFSVWAPISVHGAFAARYYASQYPSTHFTVKALPTPSLRDVVQQWLVNGTDCDYVGLGDTSSNAIAVSPLVPPSVAWIDGSATSTELSNKETHPTFRRVVPTDAVGAGGAAVFAVAQGWNLASVLCEDNAYGRSVAEGFASKYAALGGQVEFSRCFPSNADDATALEILRPLVEQSSSRVLYVAGMVWRLEKTLRQLRVPSRMMMIFSEANCTTADLAMFPGAFCARYATLPGPSRTYQAAYTARDTSVDFRVFEGAFTQADVLESPADTFWGAMGADAVHVAMEAIATYHAANKTRYPTMSDYVTSVRLQGLTGTVSFLPNGDRETATLALYNMQPPAGATDPVESDFTLQQVAVIDGDDIRYSATTGSSEVAATNPQPALWYSVDGGSFRNTPPAGVLERADAAAENSTATTVAAVVGSVVALLGAIVAAVLIATRRGNTLAHAPLDEDAPFTVFFVAVKNESTIRDLYPAECAQAFAKVSAVVRAAARACGCHEARRINDTTVMVVSKTPQAALECASRIVKECADEPWSAILTTDPDSNALTSRDDVSARSRRSARAGRSTRRSASYRSGRSRRSENSNHNLNAPEFTMPLVNIGLHTGFGSIDHDEATGVVSYHGTVVDEAACITDAAVGGQIAVSEEAAEELLEAGADAAGTFAEFRNVALPATAHSKASSSRESSVQTFTPPGYTLADDVNRLIDRALSLAHTADTSAGVTAALSQADCGLAEKRIAMVCIHVPALALDYVPEGSAGPGHLSDPAARRDRVAKVVDLVSEAAQARKGVVWSLNDERVYVCVNGFGHAVARPETRALMIALDVCVDAAPRHNALKGATAGVAFGRATVGEAQGCPISLGTAVATSRMMQVAASHLQAPVLATDTCFDDIKSTFHALTVDCAAVPTGAGPRAAMRLTRLVAVTEARDTHAEGEWLYHVQAPSPGVPAQTTVDGAQPGSSSDGGASLDTCWEAAVTAADRRGAPGVVTSNEDLPAAVCEPDSAPAAKFRLPEMPVGSMDTWQVLMTLSLTQLGRMRASGTTAEYADVRRRELQLVF